jgi:hypothetical protein
MGSGFLEVGLFFLGELAAVSGALGRAGSFEFGGIDGGSVVSLKVEQPVLGLSILELEIPHGKLFVDSRVVVVEILAGFGPVGHGFAIHCLNANVGAILLQPIVANCSEALATLAAKIFGGEGDVGPAIRGEDDVAGETSLGEGSGGQQAHLIIFPGFVLIAFGFEVPIVKVGKGPVGHRVVIDHLHLNGVDRVTTPARRGLPVHVQHQHSQKHNGQVSANHR